MPEEAPFLSLVVPCYNEAGNLPALLGAFASARGRLPGELELILVDNGSTDGTAGLLPRLLAGYPFARAVTVPVNRGYGHGITTGLRAARGEYAGWTHGDLQYRPEEALRAAAALLPRPAGRLLIKGERSARTPLDSFFTVAMSVFESMLFLQPLWDINAQPTIFHRSLLENWESAPDGFLLDLFALVAARRSGFRIERFPMRLESRGSGISSWNKGMAARVRLCAYYMAASARLRLALAAVRRDK